MTTFHPAPFEITSGEASLTAEGRRSWLDCFTLTPEREYRQMNGLAPSQFNGNALDRGVTRVAPLAPSLLLITGLTRLNGNLLVGCDTLDATHSRGSGESPISEGGYPLGRVAGMFAEPSKAEPESRKGLGEASAIFPPKTERAGVASVNPTEHLTARKVADSEVRSATSGDPLIPFLQPNN